MSAAIFFGNYLFGINKYRGRVNGVMLHNSQKKKKNNILFQIRLYIASQTRLEGNCPFRQVMREDVVRQELVSRNEITEPITFNLLFHDNGFYVGAAIFLFLKSSPLKLVPANIPLSRCARQRPTITDTIRHPPSVNFSFAPPPS